MIGFHSISDVLFHLIEIGCLCISFVFILLYGDLLAVYEGGCYGTG